MTAVSIDFSAIQVVTVSGTSAQSAVFTVPATVRLSTNTACWIKVGTNPTAVADTAGNLMLPTNYTTDLLVPAGSRIAVIHDSGAGQLCVAPILNVRG